MIRDAQLHDLAAITALERECFSDPWSADAFTSAMRDSHGRVLVALDAGGNLQGYSVYRFVLDEGELSNIAVGKSARRAGVAKSLLDAMMMAAREQGVHRIFLEVRESNEAALRLYEASGFQLVGRRRRYYSDPTEDALLMQALVD